MTACPGSPPQVRVKVAVMDNALPEARITPAGAGKRHSLQCLCLLS
ncbi:hypothetical protein LPICM02_240012 [Pseudolactococcus piscium]|nr:hypothetical protein LPICM02_240012 [Lactococcus piscium]